MGELPDLSWRKFAEKLLERVMEHQTTIPAKWQRKLMEEYRELIKRDDPEFYAKYYSKPM